MIISIIPYGSYYRVVLDANKSSGTEPKKALFSSFEEAKQFADDCIAAEQFNLNRIREEMGDD